MDKLNEIATIVGIVGTVSAWSIFKPITRWFQQRQLKKSERLTKAVEQATQPLIEAYEREHKKLVEELYKQKKASISVLHDRVYQEGRRLLKQGWATMDDIDNFLNMYQPYLDLGGNGTGEAMGHKVLDLPVSEGTDALIKDAQRIHEERDKRKK